MSSIILYHHLRLGDHFMCHGIVREYCKKYDRVVTFCWPHNYPTVSFMYRDLPNLTIIQGGDDDANNFIKKNPVQPDDLKYGDVKIIGFGALSSSSGVPFETQFYQHAGVPLKKKWDSFFIKRDYEKEQMLFEKIAPQGDYAFIHEDTSRGLTIKKDLIGNDRIFFTPEKNTTDNIIDYCTIIEKAKEIHVIDSSFMFLIDCLPYSNPNQKLFVHRYARENDEWLLPILKKDWYIFVQRYDNLEPEKWGAVKNILAEISGIHNTITKRFIRKIFNAMDWGELKPKHPDLEALIWRYAYGKSFLEISPNGNASSYLSTAHKAGATMASSASVGKARLADIVFYSGAFSQHKDQLGFLKKLHSITKMNLIFYTKNLSPEYLESMLTQAGFETREKHLFLKEVCFVCRVIPENNHLS